MSTDSLPLTMVQSVAAQLEDDMQRRGLRPGDRYMTAAQASEMLSVSPVTVNRAMQMLADRELLVRRRSRGTFVGPNFDVGHLHGSELDVVHMLMAMDYHDTRAASSDLLVDAVTHAQPGSTVEIHYLPDATAVQGTERIVNRIDQSDLKEGLVLIRSLRKAQLLVQSAGIPAVVYGQVYPGVELPCLKTDQVAIGRMLAEYAMQRGHTHFALLAHNRWRHGDNLMLESLTQTLAGGGIGLDAVVIRSLTPDKCVIDECVRSLLERDGPDFALLCRNDFYAAMARAALVSASADGMATDGIDIVSGGHSPPDGPQEFARVVSAWTLDKQMQVVLNQMIKSIQQPEAEVEQIMVPVRFCRPGDAGRIKAAS